MMSIFNGQPTQHKNEIVNICGNEISWVGIRYIQSTLISLSRISLRCRNLIFGVDKFSKFIWKNIRAVLRQLRSTLCRTSSLPNIRKVPRVIIKCIIEFLVSIFVTVKFHLPATSLCMVLTCHHSWIINENNVNFEIYCHKCIWRPKISHHTISHLWPICYGAKTTCHFYTSQFCLIRTCWQFSWIFDEDDINLSE